MTNVTFQKVAAGEYTVAINGENAATIVKKDYKTASGKYSLHFAYVLNLEANTLAEAKAAVIAIAEALEVMFSGFYVSFLMQRHEAKQQAAEAAAVAAHYAAEAEEQAEAAQQIAAVEALQTIIADLDAKIAAENAAQPQQIATPLATYTVTPDLCPYGLKIHKVSANGTQLGVIYFHKRHADFVAVLPDGDEAGWCKSLAAACDALYSHTNAPDPDSDYSDELTDDEVQIFLDGFQVKSDYIAKNADADGFTPKEWANHVRKSYGLGQYVRIELADGTQYVLYTGERLIWRNDGRKILVLEFSTLEYNEHDVSCYDCSAEYEF